MRDDSWRELPEWDTVQLMMLFRERLPARLVERHAISKPLVAKLVAWRQTSLLAHVLRRAEDQQRLEDAAV